MHEHSPHLARICCHHPQRLRLPPTDLVLCRWSSTSFFWIMVLGFYIRNIHMNQAAFTLPDLQGLHLVQLFVQTENPPSKLISDIRIIQADFIPNWGRGSRKSSKRQLIFLRGKLQIYNLPFLFAIACTCAYLQWKILVNQAHLSTETYWDPCGFEQVGYYCSTEHLLTNCGRKTHYLDASFNFTSHVLLCCQSGGWEKNWA